MDTTTPTQSSPKTADQQYADDHNYLVSRSNVHIWILISPDLIHYHCLELP